MKTAICTRLARLLLLAIALAFGAVAQITSRRQELPSIVHWNAFDRDNLTGSGPRTLASREFAELARRPSGRKACNTAKADFVSHPNGLGARREIG